MCCAVHVADLALEDGKEGGDADGDSVEVVEVTGGSKHALPNLRHFGTLVLVPRRLFDVAHRLQSPEAR
jgi:hypothetical protein